jgi:hypothetical protein
MRRYLWFTALALAMLVPGRAGAKEQTAGCPGFVRAFLRIQGGIQLGAAVWNSGNHLATYAIYRDLTVQILHDLVPDDSCGALHDVLASALDRARAQATPGGAGWDLRHGFDAFIEFVVRGDAAKLAAPRPVADVVAPPYGEQCDDLFALVRRAEGALAGGHAAEEARAIVVSLKDTGRCPAVAAALEAGLRHKQAEHALERLAAGQAPPGDPAEPPAILQRCTLLPSLVEELSFAVARGAPRFDAGRPETCLTIYREAADAALARYAKGGRCAEAARLLRKGLADAAHESEVAKGAWALRHAFDAVAQAFASAIPQAGS